MRLRALLRVAKQRSPWHAERLRSIDPDAAKRFAVKAINHFRRHEAPSAAPPPRQEKLLEEIRDLLKERR